MVTEYYVNVLLFDVHYNRLPKKVPVDGFARNFAQAF